MEYMLEDGIVYSIERIGNSVIKAIQPNMAYDANSDKFVEIPPLYVEPKHSELDIIGQQLVEKDLKIMELEHLVNAIGKENVEKDLTIIEMQNTNEVLGKNLADLEIRIMMMEGN